MLPNTFTALVPSAHDTHKAPLTYAMRDPSGDQAGFVLFVAATLCWWLPSAFMTHTPSLRTYAICFPSGDHAGDNSSIPGLLVMFATDPSIAIVQTSWSPSPAAGS